jgi:hypothetical protein
MNNKFQGLLIALLVGTVGSIYAKHDVYLKVKDTLDYDFNINGTLKNNGAVHIFLEKQGDTNVLLGNLNDLVIDTFTMATPKMQGFYQFKGFAGILNGAHKHMGANQDKDYLITINAVGGRALGKWDVKGEWIADQKYAPTPAKLINASDWNLQIQYTEEFLGGFCEMTKYLIKPDQSKVNFIELADVNVLEIMKLQGKQAAPGSWVGWATVGALDSTQEDISSKITAAKSKITNPNTETIAIIVKHVQRVTGGSIAGKRWDVEVIVVKQSDNIEDLAKEYSVTKTPGAPVATPVAGKPARAGFAPKLTAPAKTGYQVAIQNNSGHTVKLLEQHGDQMNPQVEVAKATNAFVEDVDSLSLLSFSVDGFGAYDAMPMIKDAQAKKLLKGFQKQYLIFDIRQVGKTQDTWVVKVKVRSYNADGTKKGKDEPLTYKHGGKIKQK